MIHLIPTLRPDGTLLWIPQGIATLLGVAADARLTEAQWENRELQALIQSRLKANEAGVKCTNAWHEENGYL